MSKISKLQIQNKEQEQFFARTQKCKFNFNQCFVFVLFYICYISIHYYNNSSYLLYISRLHIFSKQITLKVLCSFDNFWNEYFSAKLLNGCTWLWVSNIEYSCIRVINLGISSFLMNEITCLEWVLCTLQFLC